MDEIIGAGEHPPPIPAGQARLLLGLLLLATVLYAAGVFLPLITISKFMVVRNSFSVVSGITELLRNGQIPLFLVVSVFSVVLPVMKIGVMFKLLILGSSDNQKTERCLHLMHEYGRWAMLDVMVVAVLIVSVKLGVIASIKVHYGLYVFGAAVLLIMLITKRVAQLIEGSEEVKPDVPAVGDDGVENR